MIRDNLLGKEENYILHYLRMSQLFEAEMDVYRRIL